jgi:hypothetical protein
MYLALVITSIVLALMLVLSTTGKLRKNERVVASISGTVGVPLRLFPVLATLLLLGAAGLIVGLWIEPIGIAAAVGLVIYFLIAIIGHLRVGDTKGAVAPLPTLVLSAAVLILQLANM